MRFLKLFWSDETGEFVETLIKIIVLSMGVVAVSVGILSALRKLGGRIRANIENVDPGNL